jgi:hypothetical protein
MIEINYKDQTYTVKNEPHEFTVGEFEAITKMFNDESKEEYLRGFDFLEFIGVPNQVLDALNFDEYMEILKSVELTEIKNAEFTRTIHVKGFDYHAFGDGEDFKLKARKDVGQIGKILKHNQHNYAGTLAVIFKREDLSDKEHYDEAHLKHKEKLFRDAITLDVALPYIIHVHNKVLTHLLGNGRQMDSATPKDVATDNA